MKDLIKSFTRVFSRVEELKNKLKKLKIHRLELPTPFPQVNTVNVYLLEGGNLTLIDTGVSTPEAWSAFKNKLAELGYTPKDIKTILLTHGHVDHYGLAQKIADESGAQIFINPRDAGKVAPNRLQAIEEGFYIYHEYFQKIGVPEENIEMMKQISQGFIFVAQQIDNALPVVEGQKFIAGDIELTALEFPGHTPGMVCYYNEHHKLLFSGDNLLRSISPNPLLELDKNTGRKFKSLVEYINSLNKLTRFEIKFVLPGHFTFIDDVEGLIKRLKRFFRMRQSRILQIIDSKRLAPYEIMQKLFPRLIPGDVFLGISEVIANLEVMTERGLVNFVESDGKLYCERADRK